jgi:uncharacterized protein
VEGSVAAVHRGAGSLGALCILAAATCALAFAADFKVPPRPTTEVVDDAGALSDTARTSLESELESFESSTGHHVVVYIGQSTGNVPLETWTAETAQSWKVGQKGKDDGAILFLFMNDHKVRIEVGYGLESTLTDALSSQIIDTVIVPRMKNGDTDGAVSSGTAAMLVTIDPSYKPGYAPEQSSDDTAASSTDSGDGMGFWGWLVGGGVIFIALFGLFATLMNIIAGIARGHMIRREGAIAGAKDFKKSWLAFWIADGVASSHGGGFFSGGFSSGGGGFSGGSFGGGFGGGGASGSW